MPRVKKIIKAKRKPGRPSKRTIAIRAGMLKYWRRRKREEAKKWRKGNVRKSSRRS